MIVFILNVIVMFLLFICIVGEWCFGIGECYVICYFVMGEVVVEFNVVSVVDVEEVVVGVYCVFLFSGWVQCKLYECVVVLYCVVELICLCSEVLV